jgi:ABC-2 type transport system permease protein
VSILRVFAVADKEVRYILRDPRSLAVTFLLPLVLLVLFGYAINFDVRRISLAVYDADASYESRDLVDSLTRTEYFRLVRMLTRPTDADEVLDRGRAKVVLIIPTTFAADLAAGRSVSVQSIINGADSLTASISLSYLDAMIQDWALRRAGRQLPRSSQPIAIAVQPRVWYNEDLVSVKFIIPGLVVVLLMMVAALMTSQAVVREREQGTIEGLLVSPVTPAELIAGKIAPYMVIAVADVAIVALAGGLIFHVPLRGSPLLLLVLITAYILAALGAGLLISVLSRTQQVAYIAALIATLLPTMLLTGFVFPVSSMPGVLQAIVQLHPATHAMVVIRAIALKGTGLGVLWPHAVALMAIAGALLAASLWTLRHVWRTVGDA